MLDDSPLSDDEKALSLHILELLKENDARAVDAARDGLGMAARLGDHMILYHLLKALHKYMEEQDADIQG